MCHVRVAGAQYSGFAIVDVADDETATMWAKVAEACGWPHEGAPLQAAATGRVNPSAPAGFRHDLDYDGSGLQQPLEERAVALQGDAQLLGADIGTA